MGTTGRFETVSCGREIVKSRHLTADGHLRRKSTDDRPSTLLGYPGLLPPARDRVLGVRQPEAARIIRSRKAGTSS